MHDLFFFRIAGLLPVDQFKQTFSKDFSEEELNNILLADPTYQEGNTSIGPYTIWIIQQIKEGNVQNNSIDLTEIKKLLATFERIKNYLSQSTIDQYSVEKLKKVISDYINTYNIQDDLEGSKLF